MRINLLRFIVALASIFISVKSQSQCLVSSSGCGGYTVQVSITPTSIVPSSLTCPFGYNYNVTFNYSITVSGANNCFNGNIGVQPQIFCNSQNNGYYTILVPAPTVGTPSTNTYTGTLTTTTNPYNSATDCGSSTVSSLNCNSIDITIYGPGINATTINCNNPNNTIATANINGSPFCAGATLSVPYTVNGTFTSGNLFTAQLSNASGSFASPTDIGSVSSTTSGTITAVIPTATATGSGYRIRVVSSNPAITGTNNGANLTINAALVPSVSIGVTSGANPACVGSSVAFTATPTNGGASPTYQWTKNGVNIGGATASNYTGVAGTDFVSGDLIRCVLTSNATCVNPTTATSAAITMTITPSTSIFYITGVTDLTSCNRLEEQVKWRDFNNVAASGAGNSLVKTASNANWDGGAFSYNQVNSNGYLEFTATETNTDRMIGLSNINSNNSYSSIKYAIGLRSNGVIDIYENNSYRGTFGTYATNDVFRVSVESNLVRYYKNNVALYVSTLTPTFPMFADVSIFNVGGTIGNVLVNNLNSGGFTANLINGTASNYQWRLNGNPVGTNSASYSNPSIALNDVVTCNLTYTNSCGTGAVVELSNQTTFKALPTYDNAPIFYITGVTDLAACNRLEEQVKWRDFNNVAASGAGNSLVKTASNANWDGGAFSYNQVNSNGYLEFTATETNTDRMIGLSNTNTNSSFSSIRYAIGLRSNGVIDIYENNSYRGTFGTYATNDVFRVSVESNLVRYYKNNVALYVSTLTPTFPMFADVSIFNVGGTIGNVLVNNLNSGGFTATIINGTPVTYQWRLNGNPVGTNSASYNNPSIALNDLVTCDLTYQSVCSTPTITTNSTTFKALPTYDNAPIFYITGVTDLAACNRLEEQVKWRDFNNVAASGAGNSLVKTASNANWDGGAFSYNQVNSNGYLEFTATETNTDRMIGLSNTNTNSSFSSIRYAIGLRSNGVIDIYENNSYRGTFGTYATNDVFRVSVESNLVRYYKNNVALYVSTLTPTFPMFADVSIFNVGGTIGNVLVNNLNSGGFTATIINGTPVTYQWRLNGNPVGTNSASYNNPSIALNDLVTCDLTYQSVCSTPTITTNSTTFKALPTYDNAPIFYITGVTDLAACNRLEEQVKWRDFNNVAASGAGNSLVKTASNANWDGGAFSYNQVNSNGYLEFTATETNTDRMIGLSNTNTNSSFSSIRYAIGLRSNGVIDIYENNSYRGTFGTYATNDVFRVSVESNLVRYYKNNVALYVSTLTPTFPMFADVSIFNVGGTIGNVLVNNLNSGGFTATIINGTPVTYQWRLNGNPVGTNSASYNNPSIVLNDLVTCDLTYQSVCSTPTITTNSTTFKALPTYDNAPIFYITGVTDLAACNRLEEQVKWRDFNNVAASGAGNSLVKTASNANWDGGAFSYNQVNSNGYLEFTATETNTDRMIGLSNTNTNSSFSSIRYAIGLRSNGVIDIYENNSYRGTFGTYATNDVFRVSVESNLVRYYKNNVALYVSTLTPTFPMFADVSIFNVGGTIGNVLVNNLNSGGFTATIINGTPVTYQWRLNGNPVGTNSASYNNPSIALNDLVTCDLTYQSVCSTPTITTNSTTFKALPTYDNAPIFYITGVTDLAACNRLEEQVKWRDFNNVAASGAGNSLVKTASNANWDGGAFSYNQVNSNGYLEFTATETNTDRMIGLSNTNTNSSFSSIRYAIGLRSNGVIDIYENNSYRGTFGTYATNDVFRVSVESNLVRYYKNNVALYVSTLTPTFPMFADVSIFNVGGTIGNVLVNNLNSGGFTATIINGTPVTYQWRLNGNPVGTNSASYNNPSIALNDLVTCDLTYQSVCSTPTITTNSTTFKALPTYDNAPIFYITGVTDLAGCFRAEEKIVWNSLSNMATTGSGNGLIKTTSNNNWDGGAFSYNQVFNNGYLEFTATETNTDRMIGLSNTNTNSSFSSIRYAIGLRSNGVIDIYENNSYRGTFGTYATNDVFRVSVESNIVKYYKNNTLLFTSSLTPTTPLFADVSFYNINATIANPVIANLTTGSFSSSLTNGAASSYNWKLNGSPVGTNSSTYSNSSITVSDIITCDLVYNSVCATPTISSNSIRIINGIGSPALISIGANPSTTNCQGTSVTFTATPTNGGASPSYQWTKNGVNIGGASASTYTGVAGTDFVSGDLIRCVLTSNATCASPAVVTSAPITMAVTPQVTPTISISQNNANICSSGISFTSTISNGGATPAYQWFINNVAVGGANASTFTPSNPVNGSQVTCQLTSSLTCVTAATVTSNAVTLSIAGPVTTWLGTSNSWNSATNWSSGIPNSNLRAIIPTAVPNQPLITTAAVVFDVVIDAGATLTIGPGGSLDVHNDFVNNGTFNAGVSTVSFLTCGGNNQQHNIAGSTVTTFNNITLNNTAGLSLDVDANLIGELNLLNGTFNNSASTFTLVSNAAGTARIAPVAATANFVGNITMQRFAPGPNTGWAHLGAPVQGVTLAQWQDDFMTSGFPGATNNAGGFISIWTYNESTPGLYDAAGSYIAASSVSNNVSVGKGFWVYLGTNTVTTNDITIDVTGQPTIGNFNFNPSYTNSGDPLNDGFNLIANPYPSTIDWLSSAWTKTNVNNAIYMYQADNTQYASFVGGIGVNGATRHIASSQGFYIQTNGASPVLNISENAKSSVNAVLIKDEDPANTLRLKIHSDDKSDEMVIHLNSNATKAFDGNYDAFKFFNNNSTNPTISSIAANKDLSINTLPFGGDSMKVPVRVTVGASGMYHISWSGMNKFPLGTCFVIEDLKNGNKSLLDKDGVYYFTEDAGFKSPRFLIHITTPVTYKSTDITCSNINDGSVTVENNAVSARKVILRDLSGNFVQEAIVGSNSNFTFTQLASGNYLLVSPSTSICGDFTQMIEILPAASIAAKFEVSKQVLEVNEKVVLNTAQDKGNNLSWNLGDGNMIEGENSIAYQYQTAGDYTVTLTNTKGACTQTESKVLTVRDAQVTDRLMDVQQVNDEFYAVFRFADITTVTIRLTNALGQEVTETLQFEGKNGRVRLPIENTAVGVYMVVLNTGKDTITKKIVKK